MEDLIKRQDAIDAMYRLEAEDIETYGCSIPEGFDSKPAIEALRALPSAEPERKKGVWIEYPACLGYDGAYSDDHIVCSECEHVFSICDNCTEEFDFCPNCGAEMSGGDR